MVFAQSSSRGLNVGVSDRQFDELVRRHYRAVLSYARATTSASIAEDAVQETFLKAWRYFDSFRGDGSFEGWLIRICRRCIIDLVEREQRNASVELPETIKQPGTTGLVETVMLIETLSLPHREVVALCGLLGYDYETAAQVLDVPVGTVRSRLSRARALLAEAHEVARGETA